MKAPVLSSAPRGVPTLSKWRRNRDGSISAYIFGSSGFRDGETITTSQIATGVAPGAIVETKSGSKYFLDAGMDKVLRDYQAKKRQEAQRAAKEAADEKRRLAEKKRKEFEAKKAAKQANALAGNAKPGKTINLFGLVGGQPQKSDNTVDTNAEKVQQTVAKARPGATIPLFGGATPPKTRADQEPKSAPAKTAPKIKRRATISLFGLGEQEEKSESGAAIKPVATTKAAKIPKGMPSMARWKRNFDGSVSGFISGSSAFAEGERITTSPIEKGTEIKSGSVVVTASGSKYFLL